MADGTQFLCVVALFSNSETVLSGSHITRDAQGDRGVRLTTTASSWTRGSIGSRRPCVPGNAVGNSSPLRSSRCGITRSVKCVWDSIGYYPLSEPLTPRIIGFDR